jgi:hypothetical protein
MIEMYVHVKSTLFTLLTIVIFQTNAFNYDPTIFAQNTSPLFPGITSIDEGKKDLTGKYTNDRYGINNFVIPQYWYASELILNDNIFVLNSLEWPENEVIQNLLSGNDLRTISLSVLPTSDIENTKSQSDLLIQQLNSTGMNKVKCNQLEQTSNSLINNIPYNISSVKCKASTDNTMTDTLPIQQDNNMSNVNTTNYIKTYSHEKPDKMYNLVLSISSLKEDIENDDIVHYNSILDSTSKTLEIE